MSTWQRTAFRLLVRILPATFRSHVGAQLEDAVQACIERERARLGLTGVLFAWGRILVDLAIAAVVLRWPAMDVRDVLQEISMPRLVRGHRGYAFLAVTSFSLAVGITLAVFTVVNALWLRPLPVPESDRVVMIVGDAVSEDDTTLYSLDSLETPETWPMFDAVAGRVATTGDHARQAARLAFDMTDRDVEALGVTSAYFEVLGQTIRGRELTREDSRPGAEPAAIISDRFWTRAFPYQGSQEEGRAESLRRPAMSLWRGL